MLANGVPMKQIQEWLGHADFGTTANIYSHLDYTSKQNSANKISSLFNFVDSKQNADDEQINNSLSSLEKDKEKEEREKLEKQIAELQAQLKQQQEDEEYQQWLFEREQRRKKQMEDDGPEM